MKSPHPWGLDSDIRGGNTREGIGAQLEYLYVCIDSYWPLHIVKVWKRLCPVFPHETADGMEGPHQTATDVCGPLGGDMPASFPFASRGTTGSRSALRGRTYGVSSQ